MVLMEVFDANVLFGFWPRWQLDGSPAAVRQLGVTHGIARQLVCSMRAIFYDPSEGNDETLRWCRQQQGFWSPAASVNPLKWPDALVEIDRMAAAGVRVIRFFPELQGWDWRLRPFRRALARIRELGAVAMVSARVGGHLEAGSVGQLADLLASTETPCILTGVYYGNLGEALEAAQALPQLYLETDLMNGPDTLALAAAHLGPARLVYGSFSPIHAIDASLLPLQHSGLDEAAREAVAGRNLARLLGWAYGNH